MEAFYNEYISFLDANGIAHECNTSLAEHSSFRIGGNVDIAVYPETSEQAVKAIRAAKKIELRYMVVGNGSNLLFDDAGFRGAIIFTKKMRNISTEGSVLRAESGASLLSAAVAAKNAGLGGFEFAYGIPGSCGGAVCMNAGAYGGELADVVKKVTLYDAYRDEVVVLAKDEMHFSYRNSIVGNGERYTVLSAELQLEVGDISNISEKMNDIMRRRVEKQPLNYPSAGSVFKRSAPDVYVGKMIEECGLKGYSVGNAQVSEKHAGFIINRGGATARDVSRLIEYIQNTIMKKYGIKLECEIRRVPER